MQPTAFTLSEHAAAALDTDGFVVLPGPLPSSEIRTLQQAYDTAAATAAREDVRRGSASTRINDFVNREALFDRIYTWPAALDAARRVVGGPFRLSAFHARTLHPEAPAQELHVDVPRTSDAWPMLGLIFMVDEFRADNGATRFIPGSQRRLEAPAAVLADVHAQHTDEVLACGPAGSVILFNASTWHGHTRNSSGSPRRSLQATFIPSTGRPATDFGARMQPKVLARLSPVARELLGLGADFSR
jgi:ectoine hydroxylase-related dioxygenase (phytanoyl-CoA dioxygenase family)